MKNIKKVAVLGGGGRTGKYLVSQLLKEGFSIKLLLRNAETFTIENSITSSIKEQQIEIVKGDALDVETIKTLLADCQAVISTIGQRKDEPLVASKATKNILKAMEDYNIHRYVLLAGLNIDTPFDKKSDKTKMATEWMKTNFPLIQEDRQKAYNFLVESNVNWTQVRIPFIEFTDLSSEISVSVEDCLGDKISAQNIANFMISEMMESKFERQSPFISSI